MNHISTKGKNKQNKSRIESNAIEARASQRVYNEQL
jgi:hypothetical protein